METSKYLAQKTLLEYGVNSLPIEIPTIIDILKKEGYSVLHTEEHIDIIKPLLKENFFEFVQKKAFTICSEDIKAVFYSLRLTTEERLEALAHELAHIRCGHIYSGKVLGYCDDCNVLNRQELESQEFMREFLAPVCVLKKLKISTQKDVERLCLLSSVNAAKQFSECSNLSPYNTATEQNLIKAFTRAKKHLLKITTPIIVIILLSVITATVPTITPTPSPVVSHEPSTVNQTENLNSTVIERYIITSHGTKYHMSDCQFVKNKTNITSITIEQAKSLNKTPCSRCIR